MAGEGAQIMPCPSTGQKPKLWTWRKREPSLGPCEGSSGELQTQCPGLTRFKMHQHQSTFWTGEGDRIDSL